MMERASDDEEKRQRRTEIIDAAVERFEEREYEEITMAEVARGAGIAKGTVYLYFDTKAELFLHVAIRLITTWFDELDSELENLPTPVSDPERVGRTVASTLDEAEELKRILPILHSTLERNIGVDVAIEYKERLAGRLQGMAAVLETKIDSLEGRDGMRMLLWLYAFIVGIDQLANPPPPVADAIEREGLELFDVDFEEEVAAAMAAWLRS